MRANGEMDAQHDAGAATQLQEQIEEESRDFKSSFCEFRNKRRQTKFIVRAIPNASLKELFLQMDSDLGCEVTCDVRTIKEYQLENCGIL